MASVDKLSPNDKRVSYKTTNLNGHHYHYILSTPQNGHYKATIFLIHGWPDLAFSWRYQMPFLTGLGLRVVAMDMMGYGGTDAPQVPPQDISLYGFKRASDDIAALAKELNAPQIILGGHDWGGAIVYRTAMWHPKLVTHVFSICTPYWSPSDRYISTEDLVNGPSPQLGYQLQFATGKVEANIKTKDQFRNLFNGIHGGKPSKGGRIMLPQTGLNFDVVNDSISQSPLVSAEDIEYYAETYARKGIHGPCRWYATRRVNFEEELSLKTKSVEQPVLYLFATQDRILTKELAAGMERDIPRLTRRDVSANHWAHWERPAEVNSYIKEWLQDVVFGTKSSL